MGFVVAAAGCVGPAATDAEVHIMDEHITANLTGCNGTITVHSEEVDRMDALLPPGLLPVDLTQVLFGNAPVASDRGALTWMALWCEDGMGQGPVGVVAMAALIQRPDMAPDEARSQVNVHAAVAGVTNPTVQANLIGDAIAPLVMSDVAVRSLVDQEVPASPGPVDAGSVQNSFVRLLAGGTAETHVAAALNSPVAEPPNAEQWRIRVWQPAADGLTIIDLAYAGHYLTQGAVECEYSNGSPMADYFGRTRCIDGDFGLLVRGIDFTVHVVHHEARP